MIPVSPAEWPAESERNPEAISPVELTNFLLRYRRLIVGLSLAVAVLVALWAVTQPIGYKSSAAFLTQSPRNASATSGAAALARQLGFGTTSPSASETYVQVVTSRELLRKAVENPYQVRGEGRVDTATLVTLYGGSSGGLVPPWLRATKAVKAGLQVGVDEEGVVTLTLEGFPPELGEQILRRLLVLLDEFNQETRRSRAQQELRFANERMAAAQSDLTAAEERLKMFLRGNRTFEHSPDLTFQYERLRRQVEMQQQVFLALARGSEQSSMEANRDTPLLTIIDAPEGASEPIPRVTVVLVIVGLLVGALLAIGIGAAREFGRRQSSRDADAMLEFRRLKREMLEDVRHPLRIIRGRKASAAHDSSRQS